MEEPLTEELLNELLGSSSPEAFIEAHGIEGRSLSEYLQYLLDEKQLRRVDVVRDANIDKTHGYQIFTGARNASRDKLLAIAFAMGLNLKETNRLLRAGGASDLYAKTRRDAIIIFSISHGYSLQKVNEELYRFHEPTIG